MKWVVFVLVAVVRAAHADSVVSLSITEKELATALRAMPEQLEEPVGVVALAKTSKLGLEKGDVVRLINGLAPEDWLDGNGYGEPVVWLDVARRGKPVAVRLQVKLDGVASTLDRGLFREELDLLGKVDRDLDFAQVTRDGKPSGILLHSRWYNIRPLSFGDVVRKVDGVAVRTIDAFLAALDRAKDHPEVAIEVDRTGQSIVATIQLTDQPAPQKGAAAIVDGITRIKQLNDTCYEVPRTLIDAVEDAIFAGPDVDGVRIKQSTKGGAINGFQLHVMRPSPLVAKLGLADGDVVKSLDGLEPWISSHKLELFRKLRTPTHLTVAIERGGKPLTFVYLVK